MKTRDLIECAIFAAIICVFSVMTIPTGIIPVTMGTFGIMLTAVVLGWKKGTIAVLVFILLGAVGLPVFSGFKGGIGVLAGPTGGYITGYIVMTLVSGALAARLPQKRAAQMGKVFAVLALGMVLCYTLGTIQFMFVAKKSLAASLALCVTPFIPFDLIKCALAAFIGVSVRNILIKAKLKIA